MSKLTVYDEMDAPSTSGSSLKGYIHATYSQLVDLLGQPTFDEPSGDDKTQVEWIVGFEDEYGNTNVFTVYDWKTYDRNYTENRLSTFNVGGKTSAYDFIDYLESRI